jgi:hypothetical protein
MEKTAKVQKEIYQCGSQSYRGEFGKTGDETVPSIPKILG